MILSVVDKCRQAVRKLPLCALHERGRFVRQNRTARIGSSWREADIKVMHRHVCHRPIAELGQLQCAIPMPSNCVLESIIAPKELAARHKGWGPKDIQLLCFFGIGLQRSTNEVIFRCSDYSVRILADDAQTF